MIFVDSSVWIDYFNGAMTDATDHLHNALGSENLVIGDIVLTEVLQGFKRDRDFQTAKAFLTSFEVQQVLNPSSAIKSAENFRLLRSKGVTIRKTIDVIIATHCIENNLILLHSDKDFHPFTEYLGLSSLPKDKA